MRVVVALPGLIGEGPEAETVLPWADDTWGPVRVERVGAPLSPMAMLGMEGGEVPLGPLVVAALRQHPPANAVQFALSWESWVEGALGTAPRPSDEEGRALAALMPRLGGRNLTLLPGRERMHALVWEAGSLDLRVHAPEPGSIETRWPEGDGEKLLRALIEDSLDLLDGQEFNRRRRDEGLAPLNLLWPFAPGFTPSLPRLPVRLGAPVVVSAASLEFEGLARLVGCTYRAIPSGFRLNWSAALPEEPVLHLVVCDAFAQARAAGRWEIAEEFLDGFRREWWYPMMRTQPGEPRRLTLLGDGLAATWEAGENTGNGVPFHTRALDDSRAPRYMPWEIVLRCWRPWVAVS